MDGNAYSEECRAAVRVCKQNYIQPVWQQNYFFLFFSTVFTSVLVICMGGQESSISFIYLKLVDYQALKASLCT